MLLCRPLVAGVAVWTKTSSTNGCHFVVTYYEIWKYCQSTSNVHA